MYLGCFKTKNIYFFQADRNVSMPFDVQKQISVPHPAWVVSDWSACMCARVKFVRLLWLVTKHHQGFSCIFLGLVGRSCFWTHLLDSWKTVSSMCLHMDVAKSQLVRDANRRAEPKIGNMKTQMYIVKTSDKTTRNNNNNKMQHNVLHCSYITLKDAWLPTCNYISVISSVVPAFASLVAVQDRSPCIWVGFHLLPPLPEVINSIVCLILYRDIWI